MMMNNSSVERVQKQMLWIMGGCFAWLTYSHFKSFFHGLINYFKVLPSWWLLVLIPVLGISVICSIHLDEKEIKEAEQQWIESQQRFLAIERQFRLIKTNFLKIAPSQFIYYCTDLLKALGYYQVELVIEENFLQALDSSGTPILIYCLQGSEVVDYDERVLQTLKEKMDYLNIVTGILMTCGNLTDEAIEFGRLNNIKCYNGTAISKLVWLAIEESKEKA